MNRTMSDRLSLALVVIGALNWLVVGIFNLDIVASLFGGTNSMVSRIIYSIIGLAGIYSLSLFFRDSDTVKE
jgi:uncharacterized membrane protein YuzA (DUF378 family)